MRETREIKFRVWDKDTREMEVVGAIDWDANDEVIMTEPDQFILMQYTGLKDKNGVEIYEGDIVKYYDSTTMWLKSSVYDVGGAFAVKTDENPILLNDFTRQYEYDGHSIAELEVIGNVYEHPTLLKESHES